MSRSSSGAAIDVSKQRSRAFKRIFADLMGMRTNAVNFALPLEILKEPSLTLLTQSAKIEELAYKLVDCCPFCDHSRYESFLGYSDFSRPCVMPEGCSFDPITGLSVAPPLCLPFSLDPKDGFFVRQYVCRNVIPKLPSYSINCTDCSQTFHLECARKSTSNDSVIPLIYFRDTDKKGHRESYALSFPMAVVSLRNQECVDCFSSKPSHMPGEFPSKMSEKPFEESEERCSRCWKMFRLSALSSVFVRFLDTDKGAKKRQGHTELICSSCLECSHCLSAGDEDSYCFTSSLGLPKKQSSLAWVALWVHSAPPFSLLFCGGCALAIDAKEYCPVCFQLYDKDNFAIPMSNCDRCDRWVHVECDPSIDLSWYALVSKDNNSLKYTCPCCHKKKSPSHLAANDKGKTSTLVLPSNHVRPYLCSGTWILSHGLVPYSQTPHIPHSWMKHTEHGKWLVGFTAARFVPSFRVPGKKTVLLTRVLRGWEPTNESPRLEVQFLDHMENELPHWFALLNPSDWEPLWVNLWLKWMGHHPPFSKLNSLEFICGGSMTQNLGTASFVPRKNRSLLKCTRAIPGIQRKNNLSFGKSRHAISGTCGDETIPYNGGLASFNRIHVMKHSLSVGRSAIQGLGIYATIFIEANVPLLPYYGVIVGPHLAENLESLYESLGLGCYFFKLSPTLIIDATLGGSSARFVNHSCDPNCITRSICSTKTSFSYRLKKGGVACTSNCKPSCSIVVIYSKRDICPGEELTYDYMFKLEGDPSLRIPCGCGSPKCRGFMN